MKTAPNDIGHNVTVLLGVCVLVDGGRLIVKCPSAVNTLTEAVYERWSTQRRSLRLLSIFQPNSRDLKWRFENYNNLVFCQWHVIILASSSCQHFHYSALCTHCKLFSQLQDGGISADRQIKQKCRAQMGRGAYQVWTDHGWCTKREQLCRVRLEFLHSFQVAGGLIFSHWPLAGS